MDVRNLLRTANNETQTIRDIQAALPQWRGTIVHLAVLDMRRHGEVELEDDLAVRVLALDTD